MSRRRVVAVSSATGYGSVFFPTNGYLGSGSALTLGTTCTFECWFKTTADPASSKFVLLGGSGNRGLNIYNGAYGQGNYSATVIQLDWETAGNTPFTVPTMAANTWYHLAVTFNAGTATLWLNGTRSSTGTVVTGFTFGSQTYRIGAWVSQSIYSQGVYISTARLTTTAVYDITQSTITVPTGPLTAITGTQLLLNMATSTPYTDSSTNAITMTALGGASWSSRSPFVTENSSSTVTATLSANVSIGTANGSPFSSNVNSYTIASQPGSTPYNSVSVLGSAGFAFGTGDFTVEWFQYVITSQINQRAFWYGTGPSLGVSQEGATAASRTIYAWAPSFATQATGVAVTEKVWQHHALVRISGKSYYYINGNVINPSGTTFTANITDTTSTFYFMSKGSGLQNEQLIGSMTNMRVVKGLGVYTGNFTKPNSPLTQTAGANPYGGSNTAAITSGLTSLLLNP